MSSHWCRGQWHIPLAAWFSLDIIRSSALQSHFALAVVEGNTLITRIFTSVYHARVITLVIVVAAEMNMSCRSRFRGRWRCRWRSRIRCDGVWCLLVRASSAHLVRCALVAAWRTRADRPAIVCIPMMIIIRSTRLLRTRRRSRWHHRVVRFLHS